MDRDPKDKIVVVTGAAQGIGYAIAKKFLVNCAKNIIILDINEKLGQQAENMLNDLYGGNKVYFKKCDVITELETVAEDIYKQFGRVDVLVNNAGVAGFDTSKVVDINLKAVIEWSFYFWKKLSKDKSGSGGTIIINISSLYGVFALQHYPVYHATKFGVVGFSKSLGHEFNYNRSGVRVMVLCPGFTETKLTRLSEMRTFDDEGLLDSLKDLTSKAVFQDPGNVGEAAVEIFKKAQSGSLWKVENGEPTSEIV